jgi:hypothetical protein
MYIKHPNVSFFFCKSQNEVHVFKFLVHISPYFKVKYTFVIIVTVTSDPNFNFLSRECKTQTLSVDSEDK